MLFLLLSIQTLFIGISAFGSTPAAEADKIDALPGQPANISFSQFSGYIDIPNTGKHLHYWMQTVQNADPSTAPLVFWTNGGPGCSGLLGAMTEQGAFRPTSDLKLALNDYAWNKVANMVFIEAPVGVGYSYSENDDDYTIGDEQTAQDNYDLIQGFLLKFPELNKNDIYITSESYGGHYMPTLAKKIVDSNADNKNPTLNFKGFAVGNPYTNFYSGTPSGLVTYWGHQLVARPTWLKYEDKCINAKRPNAEECEELLVAMYGEIGDLNPYALDYPVCVADERTNKKASNVQGKHLQSFLHHDASSKLRKAVGLSGSVDDALPYDPCVDDYTVSYMNLDDVKSALHVKSDILWAECSRTVRYSVKDKESDMTSYYNYLIDGDFGLNILVYSGDDDSVCSTEGTQSWIWDLGYRHVGRKWNTYTFNDQTAGYFTQFKGKLGFLTIRNAGHEVPTYQPEIALDMFTKYLKGEWTQ